MKNFFYKLGVVLFAGFLILFSVSCTPNPQRNVNKMMDKLIEQENFFVDGEAEIESNFPDMNSTVEEKMQPGRIKIDFSGDYSLAEAAYNLKTNLDYWVGKQLFKTQGVIRFVEQVFYLKLDQVSDLPKTNLASLQGNWYKFDFNNLAGMIDGFGNQDLKEDKLLQQKKLFKKADFLKVVKDLGEDEINGVKTYHYKVKVDKDELYDFVIKATEKIEEKDLAEAQKERIKEKIEKYAQTMFDLWISEKDKLPVKVNFDNSFDSSVRGQGKYSVDLIFSDYNKKTNIEKPQKVREFNMADLFNYNLTAEFDSQQEVDFEEQLKQIENVDTEELNKQLENLQQQVEQFK